MDKEKQMKFRHEIKYLISTAQMKMLQNQMNRMLSPDPHVGAEGVYNIRSLYFDDYDNRCFYENENGTEPREKFRIRIYNHSAELIMLECKRKEHGKIHKSSCPLTVEQTQTLMKGQYLRDVAGQPEVLKRFTYRMMTRRMRPVVIVEYDRIPYTYKLGNVRITLDHNMAASTAVDRFLDEDILKRPIMGAGQQLLEVKYDELLPDYIYNNLQLKDLRQTTFSKFYLCRKFTMIKGERHEF